MSSLREVQYTSTRVVTKKFALPMWWEYLSPPTWYRHFVLLCWVPERRRSRRASTFPRSFVFTVCLGSHFPAGSYESLFYHVTESSPADGADRVTSEKGAITRRFMTEGKIMISRPQISRFMPNFVSEIYLVVLYVLYCQCWCGTGNSGVSCPKLEWIGNATPAPTVLRVLTRLMWAKK